MNTTILYIRNKLTDKQHTLLVHGYVTHDKLVRTKLPPGYIPTETGYGVKSKGSVPVGVSLYIDVVYPQGDTDRKDVLPHLLQELFSRDDLRGSERCIVIYQRMDVGELVSPEGVEVILRKIDPDIPTPVDNKWDMLANIDRFLKKHNRPETLFSVLPAKGYWDTSPTRHPLTYGTHLLYNTDPKSRKPGEYFTVTDKKGTPLGKKNPVVMYSVVRLREPDPLLESIIEVHSNYRDTCYDVVDININNLFTSEVWYNLNRFGTTLLHKCDDSPEQVTYLDTIDISHKVDPPGLMYTVNKTAKLMNDVLQHYLTGDPDLDNGVTYTDITQMFFGTDAKGATTCLLTVKDKKVYVDVDVQGQEIRLTLGLGLDMPVRNHVNRLTKEHPTITLATWDESDDKIGYYVIVMSLTGVGIFNNVYVSVDLLSVS